MLSNLTKIDWEALIKQEAPAFNEDVLKAAYVQDGRGMPGARLASFCAAGVEFAKAGKRTLLISLDYPVGTIMRKLFSICLNEPFPPGSEATPEKIEAVRSVVGDRIIIFTPPVPGFALKDLNEILFHHPKTEIVVFDHITLINHTVNKISSKDLHAIAVKHNVVILT